MPRNYKKSKRRAATRRTKGRKYPSSAKRRTPHYKRRTARALRGFAPYIGNDPFPPRRRCILHYSQSIVSGTAASSTNFGAETVFRLNSLFQVNLTTSSGQPYGFTQMAGLYNNYKVNGVAIKITATDPTADGLFYGCFLQPSGTGTTLQGLTADQSTRIPFAQCKYVNNTGSQLSVMKGYISMATIEGMPRSVFDAQITSYTANVGASPSLTPYMRVAVGSLNAPASASLVLKVEFKFYAEFWDRVVLSPI